MKLKFLILGLFAYTQLTQSKLPPVTFFQCQVTLSNNVNSQPSSLGFSSSPFIPQIPYPSKQQKKQQQMLTPNFPNRGLDFFNAPPRIEKIELDPTLASPQNQVYLSRNRGFNEYIAEQAGYPIANEQRSNKKYPYLGNGVYGRITDPNIVNLFGIKTPQAIYQQSLIKPGNFVVMSDFVSKEPNSQGSNSNTDRSNSQVITRNPNPSQLELLGKTQSPSQIPRYYSPSYTPQNLYGTR